MTHGKQRTLGLVAGLCLAAACGADHSAKTASPAAPPASALPEIPAYTPYRENVLLIEDGKPTVPVIPPTRASNDGRVTMTPLVGMITFHLFTPEAYDRPFSASGPGERMVDPFHDRAITTSAFETHPEGTDGAVAFHTICDRDATANPAPCADDPAMDCYDLTVLAAYRYHGPGVQPFELWSTPVAVAVINPKTPDAFIARVTPGTPVRSPTTFHGAAFNELSTTEDGRVLVGDLRGDPTIVYAVNPPGGAYGACDARGWTELRPVSEMFFDRRMLSYGVASYPLRDMEDNVIPRGANLNAVYPWLDRKGRNLCFTTYADELFYVDPKGDVRSRFPIVGCPDGADCRTPSPARVTDDAVEDHLHRQGVACAGLWTHGKTVLLNGRLNNGDFGLEDTPGRQRVLHLYEDHTGKDPGAKGDVLVGNSFFGHPTFAGGEGNSGFLDSIEHRFNFLPNLAPLSLARSDVVWIVASGKTTAEVAFDAYVSPASFIVASGLATVTNDGPRGAGVYNDGFDRSNTNPFTSGPSGSGVRFAPHVQNAATAVSPEVVAASGGRIPASAARWRIPAYGLAGGGVRIEPINAGGVAGAERGLWLSGGGSVRYDVPAQPDPAALATTPWYAGVFLDRRPGAGDTATSARRVLTFPDGSVLELLGSTTVRFGRPGHLLTATLPLAAPAADWVHLALVSTPDALSLYEDGLLFLRTGTTGAPLFRVAEGPLTLGRADDTPGFRGWTDRLEVYADDPGPELLCNRAMGTLVGLDGAGGPLHDVASRFPDLARAAIDAALPAKERHPLYACFADYGSELGANLGTIPDGATSLRTALLFPEGPLVWDRPRPDSSRNAFCLGCHVKGQPPTLDPGALGFQPALTEAEDTRRRPMQPPPRLSGNVPANLFGAALPPAASRSGVLVDSYLYRP